MKNHVFPDRPDQHVMHVRLKKNRLVIDENYKYESKNVFYIAYCGLIWLLAKLFLPIYAHIAFGYKVKGGKNLRALRGKAAILVANHVHVMDAAGICSCTVWRKIRTVSLSDNVSIPIAGHFLKCTGLVPLGDTYGGMRSFNNHIEKLVKKKKLILFFPEAALWPNYQGLRPFHKGAFVLAFKHKIPVLPLIYTFKKRLLRPDKVILNVGKPIYPAISAEELQRSTYDCFENFLAHEYNRPVIKPVADEKNAA